MDPAVPIVRKLVKDSALPLTKIKTALVILSVWRAKRWCVHPKSAKVSELWRERAEQLLERERRGGGGEKSE